MHLDQPASSAVCVQPFLLAGWAIDATTAIGTGIDAVYVYGRLMTRRGERVFLGCAQYGLERPEVRERFGGRFLDSGFGLCVRGLRPGPYVLAAYARGTSTGRLIHMDALSVRVEASPHLMIDWPAPGASLALPFEIRGWAADLASAAGTGVRQVRVWAELGTRARGAPVSVTSVRYGIARSDVAAVYGSQFRPSGFAADVSSLAPGRYRMFVGCLGSLSDQFEASLALTIRG